MAHVNVTIGGRPYRMACEDGQEAHLTQNRRGGGVAAQRVQPRIEDEAKANADNAHADNGKTGADEFSGSWVHYDDP